MKPPLIVINFKAYSESAGERGLALARTCQAVAGETGTSIAICPQVQDLSWIARQVEIPCFAQHADRFEPGPRTGYTVLEGIKAGGGLGTLLNHSEHHILLAEVDEVVERARSLGLLAIVCANNTRVSATAAALHPYAVAVEPPALIGTGMAVSKADPEIVSTSVETVKGIDEKVLVLCGAGITTGEDVRAAIELGAEGVLLASGVVKAKDPGAVLRDLASGL